MLTKLLHICGLYLGPENELMPAQADNPDGFWEHLGFVALNDELLNELGGAWDLPPKADEKFTHARLDPLRMKARLLIEGFHSASVWGWKDPRNSLTLPFWQDLLPRLKTLIIVRNPLEVAYSMRERNGTSYSFGLRLWEIYNRRVIETLSEHERLVTHYDLFFEDAETELRRIVRFIGLPDGEVNSAAALITAQRRHTHFTIDQMIDARVSADVIELYRALIAEADQGASASARKRNNGKIANTPKTAKPGEADLLPSTWLARMAAFLRWRRALRATKKRELSTKPRYVNLRRTFKSPKARLRKFGNTSCRRISYSTPKPLAWQRAKRGETICKAACASSCRLRGSFRDFWSRLTTRQPGFALRGAGKLQIRLLP